MSFQTINPATGENLKTFEYITDVQMFEKLDKANAAFDHWRKSDFNTRKQKMMAVAARLLEHKTAFARTMTLEMGKPYLQSVAEVEKCADCCSYFAENAEVFLQPEVFETKYSRSEAWFEPLGIIYAIMPWNFPLWQVFRCAVPAIMAGNTVVLKHAENVPQCAIIIQSVFEDAGFEEGIFTTLMIDHDQSDKVITYKGVAGVSLTGSERAGGHVASVAGQNIKRSVLELGGSDPYIVLEDADIASAAKTGCIARMQNNGQSCIAAKRFILLEGIAGKFIEAFISEIKALKIGDPMDESNYIGPLARLDLVEKLEAQVNKTVELGAKVLTGGKRVAGPGCFYEPTVITDIPKESPAYSEELFGPVASVYIVKTVEEAVALANDTDFGLGAALWTSDMNRAFEISRDIKSGSVYINTLVKSDVHIPFGGVKRSGYGRELSDVGIKEFVNVKTMVVA